MNAIVWIDQALVLAIHDRQLAEHGGAGGVRDEGLLESALARPQQMLAYAEPAPDLADLAAALSHGLARNHPFIDGNKRVAFACMDIFISLNGSRLEAEPDAVIAFIYKHLEAGTFRKPILEEWLREHVTTNG